VVFSYYVHHNLSDLPLLLLLPCCKWVVAVLLPLCVQVRVHYAAKNPELEKIEIEKRAEEQARLK
jgi:hypothetical protein